MEEEKFQIEWLMSNCYFITTEYRTIFFPVVVDEIDQFPSLRGIRMDEKVVGIQRSRRGTKIDRFQATERQRVSIQRARAPL